LGNFHRIEGLLWCLEVVDGDGQFDFCDLAGHLLCLYQLVVERFFVDFFVDVLAAVILSTCYFKLLLFREKFFQSLGEEIVDAVAFQGLFIRLCTGLLEDDGCIDLEVVGDVDVDVFGNLYDKLDGIFAFFTRLFLENVSYLFVDFDQFAQKLFLVSVALVENENLLHLKFSVFSSD
jgi:hypothetical protein